MYITPKGREIDVSGKELDETQRICRLTEENSELKIFKKYTQEACLFECKLNMAASKCGCIPWNYPMIFVSVRIKILIFSDREKLLLDILFSEGGYNYNILRHLWTRLF